MRKNVSSNEKTRIKLLSLQPRIPKKKARIIVATAVRILMGIQRGISIMIFLHPRRIQIILITRARVKHRSAQKNALQRLMGRRNVIGHIITELSTMIGSQRDTAIGMVAVTAINPKQTQQRWNTAQLGSPVQSESFGPVKPCLRSTEAVLVGKSWG